MEEKKHDTKKERVTKSGKPRRGVIGFSRNTFARPGTREYRRLQNNPQHPDHIKEIGKYQDLREKLGTEHHEELSVNE